MARISRKQLKEDRFAQEVGETVQYFRTHRRQIWVLSLVLLGLVIGGLGYWQYRQTQASMARRAFHDAMNLYYGEVSADPSPGGITFATNVERVSRTTAALEEVSRDFPNRREGAAARYYLALLDLEQGNREEGIQKLRDLLEGPSREVSSLARLALAEWLEKDQKLEEAREHYQYLVDHPTEVVPKPRAQLKLATLLVETDPEQAKPILQELQSQPSRIAMRATSVLAQIESELAVPESGGPIDAPKDESAPSP